MQPGNLELVSPNTGETLRANRQYGAQRYNL